MVVVLVMKDICVKVVVGKAVMVVVVVVMRRRRDEVEMIRMGKELRLEAGIFLLHVVFVFGLMLV